MSRKLISPSHVTIPRMPPMSDTTAQNPMQPSIQGYRKFDQATSDFINEVKETGKIVEALLAKAPAAADARNLALAKTNFQQAAMWLIRAAAKPDGLF